MNSADAALKVAHHHFCVLYDSTNGRIVSTFESITLEGAGPAPRPEDLEARARTQSDKLIRTYFKRPFDQTNVKAILVGPEALAQPGLKKVDLQRRMIVPAEN